MSEYKPLLQTKRFDIFHHQVVRNPKMGLPKDVYEAWYRDEDVPRSVCEVTVWASTNPHLGNYVEWLHVCEWYRRQGIATEVLEALEKHLGQLSFDGATDAGEAFCEAYDRRTDSETP